MKPTLTVVREILLDPFMFNIFTREGSIIVVSEPESSKPYVETRLPTLLITSTRRTGSNTSQQLAVAPVRRNEMVPYSGNVIDLFDTFLTYTFPSFSDVQQVGVTLATALHFLEVCSVKHTIEADVSLFHNVISFPRRFGFQCFTAVQPEGMITHRDAFRVCC